MQNHASPIPTWRPYADRIIARLAEHHGAHPVSLRAEDTAQAQDTAYDALPAEGMSSSAQSEGLATAQLDKLLATDSAPQLLLEDAKPLCEASTNAAATRGLDAERPVTRLPPHRLSMVIRLAATIGSAPALQSFATPGALTLITGIEPSQLDLTSELIRQHFCAPDQSVSSEPRHYGPEDTLILLVPAARDDEISLSAQRAFHQQIYRAFERNAGLILLTPDTTCLPAGLQHGISTSLRLAPLNRAVLLTHLRYSHGIFGEKEAQALHDALPDNRQLAALPFTALRLALRAESAQKVALRIAELCAATQPDAPNLETMTGSGSALTTARRMIADLQLWQDGTITWAELSHSLLLYGPPGTGKTWLARAMGNSAGIAMVEASFAQWQSAGHLGDMLREMRKSFAEARRRAPALLFIDEIDAVGSRNSGDTHGSRYQTQVINGFLGEMASIARDAGVIVIGACNNPDRIDPAVLRAGRFDIKLAMPLPDAATIRGILERYLQDEIPDLQLQALARAAVGRSAASIDAAIRAARSDARHQPVPLSAALIRQHLGITTDPAAQAADWRVALHECGHAITGALLFCGTVTRVLVTPEGGETHRRPQVQSGILSEIDAELAYTLAGRAAEHLMLGTISGGAGGPAGSDLALATRLALAIDALLGLGADRPVWTGAPDHELLRDPVIHKRIRDRLDAAEQRAADLLIPRQALLHDMAQALLQQRELTGSELNIWLARAASSEQPPGSQA